MVSRAYQFNFDIEEGEFEDIDKLVDIAEAGINAGLEKLKEMDAEAFFKWLEDIDSTVEVDGYEGAIGMYIILEYFRVTSDG